MKQWQEILNEVLTVGERREDRTGVGTLAVFARQLTFDNRHEFPAVTTKRLIWNQMAAELACFLQGFETLEQFHSYGCTIWDANAAQNGGKLGPIYGVQWRKWINLNRVTNGSDIDQIRMLLEGLRKNPHGRRHLVTAWNPAELPQMCLPPCHVMWQVFMGEGGLSMAVTMRSCDLFLGLPFDIASFALLQRLLAKELGVSSDKLHFFLGDAHIYANHFEQVKTVLSRKPTILRPKLDLALDARLLTFKPSQAKLIDYEPWPAIPAPLNA